MPYSFVGLGATRVQNDLRVMGAFSGTATNIITTGNAPYVGGSALNVHTTGTEGTAVPGSTADYFCYQMSTKTVAQLYAQGGWGCSWKAMTWIDGSVTSAPIWDGTKFWLPTTSAVTGNWVGQSPDGKSWNFVQVVGSQPSWSVVGYGVTANGTWGFSDITSSTTVFRYYNLSNNSMATTTLNNAVSARPLGGGSNANRTVLSASNRLWATSDITGAWTEYPLTGNWYATVNIPGTSIWIFAGDGTPNVARSTDNLATAPTTQARLTGNIYCAAASSTAVILAGNGISGPLAYRSTDQGQTWQTVALPATATYIIGGAYANGRFVLSSYNSPNVFVSEDDGLTWATYSTGFPTASAYVNGNTTDGVRFANGRFWLTNSGNATNNYLLASSVDGKAWEIHVSVPKGVASGNATASCQGVFAAQNVAGVPTNANTSVGYGLNAFPPVKQTHYPWGVLNNALAGPTGMPSQPMGMNQWHEYQIFGRPATTTNEWNITFVVDGVGYGPFVTNNFAAKAAMPMWFMLGRGNFFNFTSDIVFYDFPLAQDPGVLGPDLRVYYDQTATDVSAEWTPSIDGAHNAEMVATTSITTAATYVYESDAPKTDEYTMKPTNVPVGFGILSTKNDAYFSRMQGITANVSVGVDIGGTVVDAPEQSVAAPVNSWTYISQQVDNNPQTGTAWSRQKLNEAQLRIKRTS